MTQQRKIKRDNEKCKEWEKKRRDRFNDAFNKLHKILPHYDPSGAKKISKIDILEKAEQFIKDLRLSNSRLIQKDHSDEKSKLVRNLQDEVNKLIIRVKQLTTTLNESNIPIPNGPKVELKGKKLKCLEKRLAKLDKLKAQKTSPEDKTLDSTNKNTDLSPPSKKIIKLSEEISKPKDSSSSRPEFKKVSINENITTTATHHQQLPLQTIILTQVPVQTQFGTLTFPFNNFQTVQTHQQNQPIFPKIYQKLPIIRLKSNIIKKKRKRRRVVIKKLKIDSKNSKDEEKSITKNVVVELQIPENSGGEEKKELSPIILQSEKNPEKIVILVENLPNSVDELDQDKNETFVIEDQNKSNSKELSNLNKNTEVEEDLSNLKSLPSPPSSFEVQIENEVEIVDNNKSANYIIAGEKEIEIIEESSNNAANKNLIEKDVEFIEESNENIESSVEKEIELEQPENIENVIKDKIEESIITPIKSNNQEDLTSPKVLEKPLLEREIERDSDKILINQNVKEDLKKNSQEEEKFTLFETIDLEKEKEEIESTSNRESNRNQKDQEFSSQVQLNKNQTIISIITSSKVLSISTQIEQQQNTSSTEEQDKILERDAPIESEEFDTSTAKISECIARSMDLIDPPEGELLELNWATDENTNSEGQNQEGPISPTQMFLSMFPLLPREQQSEQLVAENNKDSLQNNSQQQKSNLRSFFIEEMLPSNSQIQNSNTATSSSCSINRRNEGAIQQNKINLQSSQNAISVTTQLPNQSQNILQHIPNNQQNLLRQRHLSSRASTSTNQTSSQQSQNIHQNLISCSVESQLSHSQYFSQPQPPPTSNFTIPTTTTAAITPVIRNNQARIEEPFGNIFRTFNTPSASLDELPSFSSPTELVIGRNSSSNNAAITSTNTNTISALNNGNQRQQQQNSRSTNSRKSGSSSRCQQHSQVGQQEAPLNNQLTINNNNNNLFFGSLFSMPSLTGTTGNIDQSQILTASKDSSIAMASQNNSENLTGSSGGPIRQTGTTAKSYKQYRDIHIPYNIPQFSNNNNTPLSLPNANQTQAQIHNNHPNPNAVTSISNSSRYNNNIIPQCPQHQIQNTISSQKQNNFSSRPTNANVTREQHKSSSTNIRSNTNYSIANTHSIAKSNITAPSASKNPSTEAQRKNPHISPSAAAIINSNPNENSTINTHHNNPQRYFHEISQQPSNPQVAQVHRQHHQQQQQCTSSSRSSAHHPFYLPSAASSISSDKTQTAAVSNQSRNQMATVTNYTDIFPSSSAEKSCYYNFHQTPHTNYYNYSQAQSQDYNNPFYQNNSNSNNTNTSSSNSNNQIQSTNIPPPPPIPPSSHSNITSAGRDKNNLTVSQQHPSQGQKQKNYSHQVQPRNQPQPLPQQNQNIRQQQQPVNWMTSDNNQIQHHSSTTINHQQRATKSNPFSVSKLVGTSNTTSNNTNSSNSTTNNKNNFNTDSLLRKNSNNSVSSSSIPFYSNDFNQNQPSIVGHQPYINNDFCNTQQQQQQNITQIPHQHSIHQLHQQHQQPNNFYSSLNNNNNTQPQVTSNNFLDLNNQHNNNNSHQNHNLHNHHHISNFNLSSIFPEMNDKSGTNNRPNNNNNNFNYFGR